MLWEVSMSNGRCDGLRRMIRIVGDLVETAL
jgi:hypothetical protein